MSYRRSWSKTFYSDEFEPFTPLGIATAPVMCPIHLDPSNNRSRCFRAESARLNNVDGITRLLSPISVPSVLPGSKQKLIGLSMEGMYHYGWGTWIRRMDGTVTIIGDNVEIYPSVKIEANKDAWRPNFYAPNLDISGVSDLDFRIWLTAWASTGYLDRHHANLKVDCEYYTVTPPETADVRIDVINKETGKGVSQAYVALMSGTVVEADGYTDGGTITFSGVDEGSYTLKILASGYHALELSIEVVPPSVWYEAKLVPIPTLPIPWWVTPLAIGAVAFGGIVAVNTLVRRKEREPVYIVR